MLKPLLAGMSIAAVAAMPQLPASPATPHSHTDRSAVAEAGPISGSRWEPPLSGSVLRGFDRPPQPWLAGHRGVDLAAAPGDQVRSVAAGLVTFAAQVAGRGVVSVQHGQIRSTYEPVEPLVAPGEPVTAGDVIGSVAGEAHVGCACLHLGARVGDDYLDPWALLNPASRLVSAAEP